jgi:type IV secretion system protein VirB6
MGIATALEAAIDGLLNNYVSAQSAAICTAIAPLVITGVTIYIVTMGWAIMRGDAQESLHTFLWKIFRIGMILSLGLSAGAYQANAVEGIQGIQGAFVEAFGNTGTIGGLVDDMARPYEELGQLLWSESVTGLIPNFSLIAAAAMVSIAQFFLFTIALGLYLLAKVGLALVLAVGPAFIFCAMFPATKKYSESWIGQALSFVLLNVLIAGSITMLTSFASQFAEHIKAGVGNTAIIKDTGALLLCSCALGVVMLNLSHIAAGLAGSFSISGVGRDIKQALFSKK